MSTGTALKVTVNLLEKAVNYTVNILMQLGYRIESGRGLSGAGYMSGEHEVIERGFRTWITEQKLLRVRFQIYDPKTDKAYEVVEANLTYTADSREKVVKPPIEQLEAAMKKLQKLPSDAKFGVIVQCAPGYSEVPGWTTGEFKELMGGLSEEIEVGTEAHGFGPIWGRIIYRIGNWGGKQQDQYRGARR